MRLLEKSKFKDHSFDGIKKRERVEMTPEGPINRDLLDRARRAWDNLRIFRQQRKRNIRYTFGDQWGDLVWTEKGWMTERERLMSMDGQPPLQNNHIAKIERVLTGVYSKSSSVPVCFAREDNAEVKSEMMTQALQTNWERNSEKEILTSQLSEMVVGGLPVLVEEWAVQDGIEDSYTYTVNPDYFFYESKANDPRMWDVSLVGEIRDYTFNELCAVFATTDEQAERLKRIFRINGDEYNTRDQMLRHEDESWDIPPEPTLCRTFHIWTQEQKARLRCVDIMDKDPLYTVELSDRKLIDKTNKGRIETFKKLYMSQGMDEKTASRKAKEETPLIEYERFTDLFWKCTILASDGTILKEEETPYEHRQHPYIFRPHQLVAGKIVPFISVVIDQQRYVNRLITLKDMYLRSMTKGLKLIPKTLLGDLSPKEFARQAVELNGWVFYEPDPRNPHALPQVISQQASDLGIEDMIRLQVGWMNDISSISESLQGKSPGTHISASRYLMETENSTTSITSIMNKFTCFERDLAIKKMKTIHQFYQQGRMVSNIGGGYRHYKDYDPREVEDIEFDVSIKESAESPVSRMMINDVVQQMWQMGQINAEQMLEFSYIPESQDLLQKLKAAREQQEQQMQAQQAMQQQMQAQGQQQQGQPQQGQPQPNAQPGPPPQIPLDEQMGNKLSVQKVQRILQNEQPQL